MSKRSTIKTLAKALLHGGKMDCSLYESEMEMYIEDWHESLKADQDEIAFAILEDGGRVAMILILKEKTDPDHLESKIREFIVDLGDSKREFKNLSLQQLGNIHFEYIRGNEQPVFLQKYIYLYATLAIIVLILAIINNINLSVAISPIRSKEVGLKKIMGLAGLD